ncbi:hypothetical protein BDA99DRAFT_534424 [Phascolomyces articulosus]|uniref:Heterokaryon incompatibility domain-containing protein n=1 Tax=Phascolomyces articulosus TaxID=60185 RepID=A0AAD5KHT0_9FUNG|nr:hypothetical protein BDA99DRAFT_534424 [Phascolomyces articulosus]
MYITYETAQYSNNESGKHIKRLNPLIATPSDLPKPDFMPAKLVRISDMKVVDGLQVNEGYCALSYSWSQSGDIVLDEITGKYKRIDEGKHKVISYDNDIFPGMIIPEYKMPDFHINKFLIIGSRQTKIYEVFKIMEYYNYYFTTVKYVKFEDIIQQICQQFNIKYIWYDQLCINQDYKEEKHHEIRNMHHIYENAYCAVALVPDYTRQEDLSSREQQYFKRLWTLEEAVKSKRLLFVGRDEHGWADKVCYEMHQLTNSPKLSVSQILYHAHQRRSTKDHDRVFALIHLFPEFIDKIKIDYDQPFEDLMIQFYGLLAKKDISIFVF